MIAVNETSQRPLTVTIDRKKMRMARLELARRKATRPSSVRVYQFHHIRKDIGCYSQALITLTHWFPFREGQMKKVSSFLL